MQTVRQNAGVKCIFFSKAQKKLFSTENITKSRLFKYIENFTQKSESFQIKILIFFIFLLKTETMGTR